MRPVGDLLGERRPMQVQCPGCASAHREHGKCAGCGRILDEETWLLWMQQGDPDDPIPPPGVTEDDEDE